MNSNIYATLASELNEKLIAYQGQAVPRLISFPNAPNKIQVAIGMRRSGKTWLLLQTIHQIVQTEKIPMHRILYLNLEDDRFLPCSQEKLRALLDGFYAQYPDNHFNPCYLFLDEIQNADGWATVIRRFFDTKKVKIYLSGSSAKLLSKEIATSLRGRALATEVWPYNFQEYQSLFSPKKIEPQSQAWFDDQYHLLKQYLHVGGFPEVFQVPDINRRQLLQDYVEIVIMRDLIERYQITNIALVKYLIQFLLKNTACNFSVNKLGNNIKSQGLSGAKNTLYDYLEYIEDAYLAFAVSMYSESIRRMHSNPRKSYTIDAGLVRAFSFSLQNNYGHLFENVVFLHLKRQNNKIFYYLTKERYEVDFLAEDSFGRRYLYQVVWDDTDEQTMKREQRALDIAKEELSLEGRIITPSVFLEMAGVNFKR